MLAQDEWKGSDAALFSIAGTCDASKEVCKIIPT